MENYCYECKEVHESNEKCNPVKKEEVRQEKEINDILMASVVMMSI